MCFETCDLIENSGSAAVKNDSAIFELCEQNPTLIKISFPASCDSQGNNC